MTSYPPQQYQPPQQQQQPPEQQGGYTGPGTPPRPSGGGGIKLSDHMGDLVWLRPIRYDPDFIGQYGAEPAIFIDIEVLTGSYEVGARYTNSLHTNGILVDQLREHIGQEFFGRIAGRPSRFPNPAIYLAEPNPGDEQYVDAFLARRQQGQQQPQTFPGAPAGPAPASPAQPYAPPQGQPQGQPYAPPQGTPYAPQGQPQSWSQPGGPPPASPQAAPAPAQPQGNYDPPPF